jgi:hypothetical protein
MIRQRNRHHRPPVVLHLRLDAPCVRGSWKAFCARMATLTVIASFAFPSVSSAADVPACHLPINAVSISQPGAPQGAIEVHMEDSAAEAKSVHGVIRLDLRNDGPASLSELCASVHLYDSDGTPRDATVALSVPKDKEGSFKFEQAKDCLKLSSLWQAYQSSSFDLHVRMNSGSIPLSGFVLIDSTIQAKEPPPEQGTITKQHGVNMHRRLQASR